MSLKRKLVDLLFTPIQVEVIVPPRDVVDLALDDTPAAVELEREARDKAIRRLIHRTLLAESLKDPALRNGELTDFCLEARSILRPSAPGSEVLREVPAVGIRRPVPYVPGRAS